MSRASPGPDTGLSARLYQADVDGGPHSHVTEEHVSKEAR